MFEILSTALRHKLWHDLWGAKQRTLQAMLTIAIGAFVVGAIFGAWGGIDVDTHRNFAPTRPPSINVRVAPPADEALIRALRNDPQFAQVEGLMVAAIEWRSGHDAPWQSATLHARADYEDQRLALLELQQGEWPAGSRVAVERGFPIAIGDRVEVKIDGAVSSAGVGGVLFNLSQPSASLGGNPTFYVSRARFAALTGQDRFGQILADVPDYSPERAATATEQLQSTLRRHGFDVQPGSIDNTKVADPERAFFRDPVEGVGLILQSVGLVAVVLGLLLVYNTVTAIVVQQTAQIGELKAIGATSRQILLVYFALVFCYGLAALCIAVPLGMLAANALRQTIIGQLGIAASDWIVLPGPIVYQVLICLVAPLLVAAVPVLQGARVTVREAMSAYGLSGGSRLDEVLAQIGWLPRVVSLAFSNAFRNGGRVATTQLALAGAGLTFMAVISARASMVFTIGGVLLDAYPYQVQLDFTGPVSLARAEQVAELPGVAGVEGWRIERATIRPAGEPERATDQAVRLAGVPLPANIYTPKILRGRMLAPGDTHAIVLHERLADDLGAQMGDWVTLSIADPSGARRNRSERQWQVVGVLLDITLAGGAIVPREALFDELGRREVNRVQIRSADGSEAGTLAVAAQARSFYHGRDIGVVPSQLDTVAQRSANQQMGLAVVLGLLVLVALIIALVGAISLNGTLSIAVLERRREIGVLRAIGTTPGGVRTQFITEGLVMGVLSWLIALVLSYPAGLAAAQAIGASLRISVIYRYDAMGVWLWLALAALIAIVASVSPAQQAIRLSVQESLAYE
jgi:putative ABC transport system permease protein